MIPQIYKLFYSNGNQSSIFTFFILECPRSFFVPNFPFYRSISILGPKLSTSVKKLPFESGLESQGVTKKSKITINYYLVAMLFLTFDVEIIFLYPWAASFRELGWYGFVVVLIFLSVLIFGLFYEWKKGGLEWE